ncbi:MAG: hypothetical protein JJU42_07560 [Rhodobacteraceae bacterium]|nr:hypothetical protein [Paracoccaceae bacterium]
MRHPVSAIHSLRRPRLLVSAARFALTDYQREISLRLALRGHHDGALPGPADALALLLEIEAGLDALRRGRDAAWRPARHVMVLSAVMAEARLVDAAEQAKTSAWGGPAQVRAEAVAPPPPGQPDAIFAAVPPHGAPVAAP